MLPPGHIAASYILVKSAGIFGFKISLPEIMLILFASVVLDFDIIVANRLKKSHHDLFTHTPFGVFLIWLAFILLFGVNFSLTAKILVLAVFFIHLFLDELGFWFCKLGLQEVSKESQINWLYPIKEFPNRKDSIPINAKFLLHYYQKAKANVFLEIVLSLIALLVFWLT